MLKLVTQTGYKKNKEFMNSKLLAQQAQNRPNIKLCFKKIAHHATVYLYTISLDWSGSEIYHVRKKWNPFQLSCRTFLLSLIYAYGFQAWIWHGVKTILNLPLNFYTISFHGNLSKKSRAESVWISKALICKLFWRTPKKYEIEGADWFVSTSPVGIFQIPKSIWIKLIFVIRMNT